MQLYATPRNNGTGFHSVTARRCSRPWAGDGVYKWQRRVSRTFQALSVKLEGATPSKESDTNRHSMYLHERTATTQRPFEHARRYGYGEKASGII